MEKKENFLPSFDEAANKENKPLKKNDSSDRNANSEEFKRINYEILPIGELRNQARILLVKDYKELNKQKLIEAIRNAKNNIFNHNY